MVLCLHRYRGDGAEGGGGGVEGGGVEGGVEGLGCSLNSSATAQQVAEYSVAVVTGEYIVSFQAWHSGQAR